MTNISDFIDNLKSMTDELTYLKNKIIDELEQIDCNEDPDDIEYNIKLLIDKINGDEEWDNE